MDRGECMKKKKVNVQRIVAILLLIAMVGMYVASILQYQ